MLCGGGTRQYFKHKKRRDMVECVGVRTFIWHSENHTIILEYLQTCLWGRKWKNILDIKYFFYLRALNIMANLGDGFQHLD